MSRGCCQVSLGGRVGRPRRQECPEEGHGLAGAVAELAAQSQEYRQVAAGLPVVGQPNADGGNGPVSGPLIWWLTSILIDSSDDTHK